jgi:hypothetical protein
MATKDGNPRSATRPSGLCKPTRRGTNTQWDRACRDVEQRARLHPLTPAETEAAAIGYVYVMKDADGLTKIGYSADVSHRLDRMQWAIVAGPARRPIHLVSAIGLPDPVARKAERMAHDWLSTSRLYDRGCITEWFRVTPHRAGCVVRRMADKAMLPEGMSLWRAYRAFGARDV